MHSYCHSLFHYLSFFADAFSHSASNIHPDVIQMLRTAVHLLIYISIFFFNKLCLFKPFGINSVRKPFSHSNLKVPIEETHPSGCISIFCIQRCGLTNYYILCILEHCLFVNYFLNVFVSKSYSPRLSTDYVTCFPSTMGGKKIARSPR